ncbi:MAG: glycosyltransferase family 2 protein [Alphaproteobacteria bacterium]
MAGNELITIGIACFNAQDTILRALESALNQRWGHKEILIVDDASTDQSVAKIKAAIEPYAHVRLVEHGNNKGPARVRQTILDEAKGSFIVFFDDDDESLPERIERQCERIVAYEQQTGESLIACYASGRRVYPNGYVVDMQAIGSRPEVPYGEAVADRLLFYGGRADFFYGSGTPTCSLMARKSIFDAVGGFDSDFSRVEDVDFAVRVALAGGHFIGCEEQLFIQYSTQGVDKAPENNLKAELLLAEKHKGYLKSKGRYMYARKWPLLRYYHFKKQYAQMFFILVVLFVRYPFKTSSHFLKTAPKRFLHERKMKERGA